MDLGHPLRESLVAGYRVLRTLARGERSRILLGFDPSAPGEGGSGSTVALKVLSDGDAIGAAKEVEALSRAAGDHVVRLIDVSLDESTACLVFERLERGTLSDLLMRRSALDPGEVVTIVAPLAVAVERLHDAGVAHGAISPGAIVFSGVGAPVLTGFGSAVLFPAGSPEVVRELIPSVLADRAAIGDLVISLLRRAGATAAVARVEQLLTGDSAEFLGRLADLLFGSATATPVRFGGSRDSEPTRERRVVPVADPVDEAPTGAGELDRVPQTTTGLAWLAGVLPDSMRDRLARVTADPFVRGLRDRWHAAPPKRRRAAVAAGAIGVTLAIALAVPIGGPSTETEHPLAPVSPPESDDVVTDDPVSSDDPVAALRTLWARRIDCVRERSILCLDGVDQVGSGALEADRALVATVGGGGEVPAALAPDAELVLVERHGDSALVELPEGVEVGAVLLIRGPDGWRIRDYLPRPVGAATEIEPSG